MHKQKSLVINFVQKAHGIIWMPVIFLVNQRQGYLLDEWQHPGLKQYSVMRTDVMEASDKINPRWEVTFQECAAQLTNNCFLLMFYSLVKVIIYLCCFIFFQKQKTVDKREKLVRNLCSKDCRLFGWTPLNCSRKALNQSHKIMEGP